MDSPPPPQSVLNKESCAKCVRVLRDLVSGLQENNNNNTASSSSSSSRVSGGNKNMSPPLALLKAIAGGKEAKIEPIEDGVKMSIPVQTTIPTLLRRWSSVVRQHNADNEDNELLPHAIATSSNPLDDENSTQLKTSSNQNDNNNKSKNGNGEPLTIELKCRKCASTGPEGGARAFLMGPTPLSVVVCHNRIQSNVEEVEEILTHELVHLYDVQTLKLDLQHCENLAYSEVRAAKHAECRDSWKQLQKYCVKQKAICATNNLFPDEGRKCIQKVFQKAFNDNRPFEQGKGQR